MCGIWYPWIFVFTQSQVPTHSSCPLELDQNQYEGDEWNVRIDVFKHVKRKLNLFPLFIESNLSFIGGSAQLGIGIMAYTYTEYKMNRREWNHRYIKSTISNDQLGKMEKINVIAADVPSYTSPRMKRISFNGRPYS